MLVLMRVLHSRWFEKDAILAIDKIADLLYGDTDGTRGAWGLAREEIRMLGLYVRGSE